MHIREFGFPRDTMVKEWKWKKMNFTTGLPKHNSVVWYLTASGRKANGAFYRMHVVVLDEGKQLVFKLF
jgi:hypothetical protein